MKFHFAHKQQKYADDLRCDKIRGIYTCPSPIYRKTLKLMESVSRCTNYMLGPWISNQPATREQEFIFPEEVCKYSEDDDDLLLRGLWLREKKGPVEKEAISLSS